MEDIDLAVDVDVEIGGGYVDAIVIVGVGVDVDAGVLLHVTAFHLSRRRPFLDIFVVPVSVCG